MTTQSEDNILYKNKDSKSSKLSVKEFIKWLTYDNNFMRRLFPEIK